MQEKKIKKNENNESLFDIATLNDFNNFLIYYK